MKWTALRIFPTTDLSAVPGRELLPGGEAGPPPLRASARPAQRPGGGRASSRPRARYLRWPPAPPGAAMFYRPEEPHGLRGDPLNAIIVPRPIGWISSLDAHGRANLAPYSFFNAVAYRPPQVMLSASGPHERGGPKDSVANIAATGEFVVNLATWALREAVNASSVAAPQLGKDGRARLAPRRDRVSSASRSVPKAAPLR